MPLGSVRRAEERLSSFKHSRNTDHDEKGEAEKVFSRGADKIAQI